MTVSFNFYNKTNYSKEFFICIFLFFLSHASASNLTFNQAWVKLQKVNDGLAASRANKDEALFQQQIASDLYKPKIDITAGYSRLDDNISLSPSQLLDSMPIGNELRMFIESSGLGDIVANLDANLTSQIAKKNVVTASLVAIWPIYAGGRIKAAQKISKGQVLEASHLFRIKQQVLFEQLNKVYFGVVLAKQLLIVHIKAEKDLAKHLDRAEKMELQGQIARVERLKAEASYSKAKVELQKAQRNLEMAQIALNQLLKENVTPADNLFINNKIPLLKELVAATLDSHPGLGVLIAKKQQAQGLINVEKGEFKPEAFIFGNYNLYQQDTLAADLTPDWVVGIGITVPLISRSGRSGKLKAAISTLSKLDHLKKQAVSDLRLLVEKTWREAQSAKEQFDGLESSLELAYENVRVRTKAFSQGLSTSIELVDAELFLVSIETQRQIVAYEYVLSMARMLALSNQMAEFNTYQARGYYE
jgi:outer membrane protein TolC